MTTTAPTDTALEPLRRAADAAVALVPSGATLTPAPPQRGDDQVLAAFPRAVVALVRDGSGHLGLLLGQELSAEAAALHDAVHAVALTLGVEVDTPREVAPVELTGALGGSWSVVPLIGTGFAAAVLVTDGLLVAAPRELAPAASAPAPFTTVPAAAAAVTPPSPGTRTPSSRGIDMLHDVDLEVTVELGRTRMLVRDLLNLAPGDVVELDRAAGSPADLFVSGRLIARGEVVVVDEDFGLRITQILDPSAG